MGRPYATPTGLSWPTEMGDPVVVEPELTRKERRAERRRLRVVRRERRRRIMSETKDRKNRAKGKDRKKASKRK